MKRFSIILLCGLGALATGGRAATITAQAGSVAPTGYYTRHTAANTPGVGIPGGIARFRPGGADARTIVDLTQAPYNINSYGPTDSITGMLQQAMNDARDAGANRVLLLPAGSWEMNGGVSNPAPGGANSGSSITIRGAGMGQTILTATGGENGALFVFGSGTSTWNYPVDPDGVITSTITAGDTTITVTDGTNFSTNRVALIQWENVTDMTDIASGVIPVFHNEGQAMVRAQYVMVTGKSGNNLTITPGIFHTPPVGYEAVIHQAAPATASYMGVEDITLDGGDGIGEVRSKSLIVWDNTMYSWLFNVEMRNATNHIVIMSQAIRNEIRACWIHGGTTNSPSRSGILAYQNSSTLIEDNIIVGVAPTIELLQNFTAGVLAHNFLDYELNTNHGPWNFGNICIRNMAAFPRDDGFFGGSEGITHIGNWYHGTFSPGPSASLSSATRVNALVTATTVGNHGFESNTSKYVEGLFGTVDPVGIREITVTGPTTFTFELTGATGSETYGGSGTAGRGYTASNAQRRFAFRINKLGNVYGTTADPYTTNFFGDFGLPNIVSGSTNGNESELLAGSFPWDWPYDPMAPQMAELITRTSDTAGVFELLGTMTMNAAVSHDKILVDTLGYLALPLPVVLSDTTFSFNSSVTLPSVNTQLQILAPGPGGYQDKNLDVQNTAYLAGNQKLSPMMTFPSQPWTPGDQIWEPLGDTTAPNGAGGGADAVNWAYGSCPWYTSGQYGFIDRDAPEDLDYIQLPAGYAYITNTIYDRYNASETGSSATVTNTTTVTGTLTLP